MNKNKTAIITWITYHNFGTFLQAYALQNIIKLLGYDNVIISDKEIVESFKNQKRGIRSFLGRIKRLILYGNFDEKMKSSAWCYEQFAKNYLAIDDTWKSLEDLDKKYDMFICGSDQIWSPNVPFHPFYYAGFTAQKKIAYAPSMGASEYPEDKVSSVKPYLEKFSSLSVREVQGEKIIKEKFGLNCQTVIDPTLLLKKQDWECLVTNKDDQEYILCYLLTYNEAYLNFVRKFANDKGLELRMFITDFRHCRFVDNPLYVGPQEFLNEIRNAKYFFTDSFHGSIFAIQFERNFYTFKRFKENAKNNQNSRIVNLFTKLGLTDRFLSGEELDNIRCTNMIDYESVNHKLKVERDISLTYLKTALQN